MYMLNLHITNLLVTLIMIVSVLFMTLTKKWTKSSGISIYNTRFALHPDLKVF